MSESKHTPGPWRVLIDETGGPFSGWPSIGAREELDTTIVHRAGFHHEYWDWHPGLPTTLANARLIAAAPDLLAALQEIANITHGYGGQAGVMNGIARAAIAKATA